MKAPVTVVTSFGLARTPAQVGMLEVLTERAVTPDAVVGSSLGAVNAAGLAAGCHPAHLREFWQWLLAEVMASPVRTSGQGPVGQAVPQAGGTGPHPCGGDAPRALRRSGHPVAPGGHQS